MQRMSWAIITLLGVWWLGELCAAPPLEQRIGKTITVTEAGRAPEKCMVLQVWRLPDGSPAMKAQSLQTGELMTIVESESAVGAERFRVFRWGKSVEPPAGVPAPPKTTVYVPSQPNASPSPTAGRPRSVVPPSSTSNSSSVATAQRSAADASTSTDRKSAPNSAQPVMPAGLVRPGSAADPRLALPPVVPSTGPDTARTAGQPRGTGTPSIATTAKPMPTASDRPEKILSMPVEKRTGQMPPLSSSQLGADLPTQPMPGQVGQALGSSRSSEPSRPAALPPSSAVTVRPEKIKSMPVEKRTSAMTTTQSQPAAVAQTSASRPEKILHMPKEKTATAVERSMPAQKKLEPPAPPVPLATLAAQGTQKSHAAQKLSQTESSQAQALEKIQSMPREKTQPAAEKIASAPLPKENIRVQDTDKAAMEKVQSAQSQPKVALPGRTPIAESKAQAATDATTTAKSTSALTLGLTGQATTPSASAAAGRGVTHEAAQDPLMHPERYQPPHPRMTSSAAQRGPSVPAPAPKDVPAVTKTKEDRPTASTSGRSEPTAAEAVKREHPGSDSGPAGLHPTAHKPTARPEIGTEKKPTVQERADEMIPVPVPNLPLVTAGPRPSVLPPQPPARPLNTLEGVPPGALDIPPLPPGWEKVVPRTGPTTKQPSPVCAEGVCMAPGSVCPTCRPASALPHGMPPQAALPQGTVPSQLPPHVFTQVEASLGPHKARVLQQTVQWMSVLQSSPVPAERIEAAQYLGQVDGRVNPHVVEALLTALRVDPAPLVRVAAAEALVRMKASSPAVVAALKAATGDRDPRVRDAASLALKSLGSEPMRDHTPVRPVATPDR